jgi:hypothetical protein
MEGGRGAAGPAALPSAGYRSADIEQAMQNERIRRKIRQWRQINCTQPMKTTMHMVSQSSNASIYTIVCIFIDMQRAAERPKRADTAGERFVEFTPFASIRTIQGLIQAEARPCFPLLVLSRV